mgnify:CR=1 FL=1
MNSGIEYSGGATARNAGIRIFPTLRAVADLAVPVLADWCSVDVVEADIHDLRALGSLCAGASAVINLVGILNEERGQIVEAHVVLAPGHTPDGLLVKILLVPRALVMPVIFVLCAVGSYAIASRPFDILVMLAGRPRRIDHG